MSYCEHKREDTWELYDAQGIYCARVCEKCVDEKTAQYDPMIFRGYDQSDVDEPIEPDDWDRGVSNCDFGPNGML